jgi:spermidine synthase
MQKLKSAKPAQFALGGAGNQSVYIDCDDATEGHWFVRKRIVAERKTSFQRAEIVELASLGKALVLDSEMQSVEKDEYIYHEALVQPGLCLHPNPRKVLIVGGGEGATAREILKHKSVKQVVMVDLDGEIVDLAIQHLQSWHQGAFDDPRLQLVIDDGYEFVRTTDEKFDIIVIDIVSSFDGGPAEKLYTPQFYAMAKRTLEPGGVLVVQAMECHVQACADHARVRGNLAGLFSHIDSYVIFVPSFWCIWGFVIASDAVDALAMTPEVIDCRLAERALKDKLFFYDGKTHHGLFALPKDLRKLIDGA